VLMLVLLLARIAFAQADVDKADLSVDPSVAWPAIGCAALGELEGPGEVERRVCGGVRGSLASAPVREEDDLYVGVRVELVPHVAWSQDQLELVVAVPVLAQWGSTAGRSDGLGLGDPIFGLRLRALDDGTTRLALGLDVRPPLGRQQAWMGEAGVRIRPLLLLESGSEAHTGVVQAALIRRSRPLDEPFSGAPWATVAVGWRARWTHSLYSQLALHGRVVLGAAEGVRGSTIEARATAAIPFARSWIELGAGTAIVQGVGSTDGRLLIAYRVRDGHPHVRRKRRVHVAEPVQPEPPSTPPCGLDDPLEDCLPEDGALVTDPPPASPQDGADGEERPADAQFSTPSIVLDTLYFELDSERLLPESEPVLERLIADLLAHPTVGPILLEGHASQEGGFASNYQLSLRRADAIYRRLLDGGVSPSRLVQRPLGEVDDDGVPEGAPRRRVEVRLILDPLFADGDVIHPFTGQEIAR